MPGRTSVPIVRVTDGAVQCAVLSLWCADSPLSFLLVPMHHVADPGFYAQVHQRLRACGLVLAEGVRGKSWQLSTLTMAYRFALRRRRNGLALQDYATLLPADVPVINPDSTAAQAVSDLREAGRWRYLLWLLSAPVLGLVLAVRGPRAFADTGIEIRITPPRAAARIPDRDHYPVMRALLGHRDRLLLDAVREVLERHRDDPITVAVVYGAMHIPMVCAELMVRHGYQLREPEWLTVSVARTGAASTGRQADS
jgi:hypothetical protein